MFHSALDELKQTGFAAIASMSASFLPKNFHYYAGGHVHVVQTTNLESRHNIVYPGPVFPNSFSELEKLKEGSFCIVDNWDIQHKKIKLRSLIVIVLDCTGKNPAEIATALQQQLEQHDVQNTLVTMRLHGKMKEGKTSDIDFKSVLKNLEQKGAYFVMKNTIALTTPEFEQHMMAVASNDVEDTLIREHAPQFKLINNETDIHITKQLLKELSAEKNEAEKTADFEKRITTAASVVIESVLLSTNNPETKK